MVDEETLKRAIDSSLNVNCTIEGNFLRQRYDVLIRKAVNFQYLIDMLEEHRGVKVKNIKSVENAVCLDVETSHYGIDNPEPTGTNKERRLSLISLFLHHSIALLEEMINEADFHEGSRLCSYYNLLLHVRSEIEDERK